MTDQQFLNYWFLSLGAAAIVVLIAAGLLLAVWLTARSIERGAGTALDRVRQIRQNTQALWTLQDTNRVAAQLHAGAESILTHAGQIAQALHDAEVRQGRV